MATNPTKIESNVARQFPERIKDHRVDVVMENGLYRHYRCSNAGSTVDSFSIITAPGVLVYTGDMGTYVFQRTDDMIAFMRGSCHDIDYCAEKCVASDRDGITKFTLEAFHREVANIREIIEADAKGQEIGDKTKEALELLENMEFEYGNTLDYAAACTAIKDSELWDGFDFPDLREYTFRFRWCLRAIDWFCKKLDAGEVARS